MDSIKLKNLEIPCIIGIYPHERDNIQSIYLDVEVYTDLKKSALSDNIKDTLDYDSLAALATKLAVEKKYQLIETFAHEFTDGILTNFSEEETCKVTVKKPDAVPKAKYAAVTMEKSRK